MISEDILVESINIGGPVGRLLKLMDKFGATLSDDLIIHKDGELDIDLKCGNSAEGLHRFRQWQREVEWESIPNTRQDMTITCLDYPVATNFLRRQQQRPEKGITEHADLQ